MKPKTLKGVQIHTAATRLIRERGSYEMAELAARWLAEDYPHRRAFWKDVEREIIHIQKKRTPSRDEGPIQRSRPFFKRQSAEEFREKILDKHPEARVEAIPTSYAKRSHARYRVVWKSARDPGTRHRHRTTSAPSFAKQKLISRKIRLLVHEGYDRRQAAAIAYRMYGASRKA